MGTIGREFFGNQNPSPKEIELPHGACVRDIFGYFQIPINPEYTVIINKRVSKPEDILEDGTVVLLFQAAYGG